MKLRSFRQRVRHLTALVSIPRARQSLPEALEQRIAPAIFTWALPSGGVWESAANWNVSGGVDTDGIPDADDDVSINPAAEVTVTVNSTRQVRSLNVPGDDRFAITGGTFTISEPSSVTNLQLSGGTLVANGLLALTGASSWSGNSTIQGTLRNEGTLTVSGDPNLGAVLNNAGTILHNAQIDFLDGGGGRINNLAGALFDIIGASNGTYLNSSAGEPGFFNAGTFRHSGTGDASLSSMPFNNLPGGIIEVSAGILGIAGSGTWQGGILNVAAGTQLQLEGGTKTWSGAFTGSGDGDVRFTAGTITIGAGGATLNFPAGLFEWSGNTTINGAAFTNTGTLSTLGDPNLGTTLNNAGTFLHNAQIDFLDGGGGRINNLAGALFDIIGASNGTYLNSSAGEPGFFNAGTFRHSGTGDASLSSMPFNSLPGGIIEVTAGILGIAGSGTWQGGILNVAAGTQLQLEGGTKTWSGAFTGSGDGDVRFTAGTITIGAGGATLNFPAGLFEWSGNTTINGAAFTNTGTLSTLGDPNLGATLNNAGTFLHNAQIDFLDGGGGRINNLAGALFDIIGASNGTYLNSSAGEPGFFNAGTFRHSGTGDASLSSMPFNNLPGGIIEVSAGILGIAGSGTWQGGILNVAAGTQLQLEGGTKTWSGAFTGSGDGDVRFTAGTITIGAGGATLNFPAGLFEWSGNTTINGAAFTNTGTLSTLGDPNLGTTLNNAGTFLHNAQIDFLDGGGGRINNLAGALFDIIGASNGTYLNSSAGEPGFFNAGTFRHSGTGDASLSSMPFNSLPGGIIEVTAGILGIAGSGTWQGGILNVAAGTQLQLEGGTKTWSGAFTGSGDGDVRFTAGTITIGAGGATLNFPAGLFEWSGNTTINGAAFTNTGTLSTLGDPNLGTTLNNAGTFLHNAQLDFVSGGRINNLEGGVFDITGATNGSYFSNFAGSIGFFNSGILRKSGVAVANTSTVPVSNAGTVEVLGGTLTIANLAQLNAGTLSGGTWRVLGGATLSLPEGITTNAASIVLDGATAALTQLSGLATNAGSLSLLNGADLTRTGTLTNTGEIVLSPESVLTVNGNFSQVGGRLELQLAGGAASGLLGRVAITGSATLGGTLVARTLGSFAPAAGETYPLMTFGSRTGDFETFEGFDQTFNPVFELVTAADSVRLNSLIAAPDLAVTNIVAPGSGFVGKNITLSYTVTNLSDRPATVTNWTDAIYLSRDGVLDAGDFLVSRIQHTGGLAGLGSYTETLTASVPGALEGAYQVLVIADNRRVAPDLDRANNQLLSPATIDIGIEGLALGTPVSGFIAEGQDVFFQIDLASGTDVFLTSAFEAPVQAEFFISRGSVPTRTSFDLRADTIDDLEQQIRLLNPRAGTYYIMLHGREGAGDGEEFTLLADAAPFALDAIGQQFGANIGRVTVPLVGFGFTDALAVQLRSQDGSVTVSAESIEVVDRSQAFAMFDLTGVAPGLFDVVAIQSGERLLDDAFTVQAGEAGRLEARLVVPERVRMTRPYTITVEFENRGGTDIPTPLLIVQASENNFVWADGQSQTQQTDTLQFLGVDPDGFSSGVLRPGEKHTVTLNAVTNGTTANFKLASTPGDSAEIVDYAALRTSMGIDGEPPRYAAAFDRLVPDLGATYGQLIQNLAHAADEARGFGENVPTLSEAFDFLVDREILELPNANVRGTLFVEDTSHRAEWPSITLRNTATDALFIADTFIDGSFSFFDVPGGTYTVEAEDFLSLSVSTLTVPQGAPVLGLNVIADPGETLEGRVANASGHAVGSALVQITDALGREFVTATDRDGRYRFDGLAPGGATVDVNVVSFIPIDDFALTLGSGTNSRDFSLSSGGLISGRVVSPTGTPVAGAELVARLVDSDFTQTITAGFDGRFRLGGLVPGSYEILASGAGFGAGRIVGTQVSTSTATPIGDLPLTLGGQVLGMITDAITGQPIAGARFGHTAIGLQNEPILSTTTGAFSAPNLTPGSFTALITAPGYNVGFAQITLDSGENETLNVSLRPLGKIDGVVSAAGATNAAGLKLALLPLVDGPQAEPFSVVSGADGSFSFNGLPDGQYSLSLDVAGGTVARQTFTLNAADNTHTTALNLGGAELSGTVRGADGTPLSFEAVTLYSSGQRIDTTITDAQGRYEFLVFQNGPVDLIASGKTVGIAGAFAVNVTTGQPVFAPDIIAGTGTLTVNTDAAANGATIDGAMVVVRSKLDAFDEITFGGFTNAEGQFVLPRLTSGEYEVSVTKPGFATEVQTLTVATSGSTLDFLLDPGRVIFGSVRHADGTPAVLAEVTLVDRATGETFVTYSDDAGNYRRDTLVPGSYDVLVSGRQLQPVVVSDVAVSDAPVRVDATLATSNVTLKGTVQDASGDSLAQVFVRLLGPGDVTLLTALTDANGAYEMENLPAGEVRIAVQQQGFAPVITTLTLPASGETTHDLAVGEAIAIRNAPSASIAPALATRSIFFFAPLSESAASAPPSLGSFGLLDGGSGDFATGLGPPSRLGIDTAAFRIPSAAEIDPACPEQFDAFLAALNSGKRVDFLFNDVTAEFERMKGLNDADVAEFVEISKEILLDAVNLADGLGGFKDALEAIGKRGDGIVDLAANNIDVMEFFAGKVIADVKSGKFPNPEHLNIIAERFKGLAGLTTDIDFTPERDPNTGEIIKNPVALGGDLKKVALGGFPIVEDLQKLHDNFVKLNDKVAAFSKADVVKRLDQYEAAESRYEAAVKEQIAALGRLKAALENGCGDPAPDPEDPDETDPEDEEDVPSVGSRDPNDIIGPLGFGPQNFVAHDQPLDYTIRFENVATATAAAQQVVITHQLDADVDASTIQLGDFGFGAFMVDVPAGRDFFETRIDARDAFGLFVDVEAKIDTFTGLATWTFSAIDPETLDFTADPVAGFLPPNLTGGEGEGFVSYSIRASEGTPSGTRIDAQATIVFDQNEPIDTPAIFHTIDAGAPETTVTALADTTHAPRVTLSWAGSDGAGSGVNSYDVFVSDNGGSFTQYLNNVTSTTATFRGQDGHAYSFVVVAEDNVGLTEAFSSIPDAVTLVDFEPIAFAKGTKAQFTDADGDRVTIKLSGAGNGSLVLDDPDGDGSGAIDQLAFTGTTSKSNVVVSVKKGPNGDGIVTIGTVTGDGALGTFNAAKSDLILNGFDFAGAVKSLKVRDIIAPDAPFGESVIETGGIAASKLSLTARSIGDDIDIRIAGILSSLSATSIGDGLISLAALGKLRVTGGAMEADLAITGAAGSIAVKGGDLTGDIRAGGAIGALSVTPDKGGAGGSVSGAVITADRIATLVVGKDVSSSTILAGADLGVDHLLGGTGSDADSFAEGAIKRVQINGAVNASVIGAGLSTTDGIFGNADDTIIGGVASIIGKFSAGSADADSRFASGLFKPTPEIGGQKIDPATDARFVV